MVTNVCGCVGLISFFAGGQGLIITASMFKTIEACILFLFDKRGLEIETMRKYAKHVHRRS